jgi:hypothetical protein
MNLPEIQPETITQIKDTLSVVALKIGEGAEYGWHILIKQQIAEGIVGILVPLIPAILIPIGIKMYKHGVALDKDSYRSGENFRSVGGIIAGFATFITLIFLLFAITDSLLKLINPDFYAIQFLIQSVSQ